MLVWLSFWLTAYFWHSYYIKLIAIAGIAAAAAVFYAVYTLFKKLPSDNEIEGELIAEADAPRLWERIRQLAGRVQTAPPDQIIAGIDTNFFVTEAPCEVRGQTLHGRTLFVSIPLLRVLDQRPTRCSRTSWPTWAAATPAAARRSAPSCCSSTSTLGRCAAPA